MLTIFLEQFVSALRFLFCTEGLYSCVGHMRQISLSLKIIYLTMEFCISRQHFNFEQNPYRVFEQCKIAN
jgi:hypothetical protein